MSPAHLQLGASAAKSPSSQFAATPRRQKTIGVAVGRHLVLAGTHRLDPVDPHQSAHPALADTEPCFLERPTISLASCEDDSFDCPQGRALRINCAAKAQAILLANMGKDLQVSPVAAARGPRTPRSIAARTDPHYPANRLYWPHMTPALHECEPHGRWLAKNCPKRSGPFLIYPSPPSEPGSQGEAAHSQGLNLLAAPPPDHWADIAISTFAASTCQPPNQTQSANAANQWSAQSAPPPA